MSFFLATVTSAANRFVISNPRTARLGSPTGFLASHIASLGSAAESAWSVAAAAAIRGTGGDPATESIFFRPAQEPGDALEFYRLESIHGISTADRTDIVFHFQPVTAAASGTAAWTITPGGNKELSESLSMTGGTSGGTWRWTDPPMAIGCATVGTKACGCGSSATPSCGGTKKTVD